ncbi:CAP-Gly domain-containing linker protein 3-like isoform X2 [Ornithodoros turicata]|uniref:CAP-Gly domain-containing linker protein 3-like isoform X2 n=1 Tax=Ornithodoros turicata TaxID=34597 RepID=UPI003139E046
MTTEEDERSPPKASPVPLRQHAIVYQASDAPVCLHCRTLDMPYFDTGCRSCLEILHSNDTKVPEIFAIIRQWAPQTQQDIKMLVTEVLRRGANVNDRDGLTDMTLLHYACKSGAEGIGSVTNATRTVGMLLDMGADVSLRCCWTDMAAIHYAAYFDVPPVIELLLKASRKADIDSPCQSFDNGTALHIAATNLCFRAAQTLVEYGANLTSTDNLGRTPMECIVDPRRGDVMSDASSIVSSMQELLKTPLSSIPSQNNSLLQPDSSPAATGRVVLQSLGLKIGDQVAIGGAKVGILRYCGTIHFAAGVWAGVELYDPLGKNDGSLGGISYFHCDMNHGIFAPITKVQKYDGGPLMEYASSPRISSGTRNVSFPKVDISRVAPKVETGLSSRRQKLFDPRNRQIAVGDCVMIGQRKGIVKFVGETQFAPGQWCGIELFKPQGKNDGSVNGVSYFTCPPNHGIFAPPTRVTCVPASTEEDASDPDSLVDMSTSASRSSTEGDTASSPASQRSYTVDKKSHSSKSHQPRTISTNLKKGCWLATGMNVFVRNELGVLRYMGPVHFGEGTWLGVELRTAHGRNDGSVQGHRYFACKPNHGLLVRPSKEG